MRRRILLIVVATLAIAACGHNRQGLSFNPNNGREAELTMPDGRVVKYTAYEHLVYVRNVEDTAYQYMNVYVPEGAGKDAPILLRTYIGGYMAAKARAPQAGDASGRALLEGYVVAIPGARGRNSVQDNVYNGRAPQGLLDLKAAIRYLRLFDRVMPGNAERIIVDGTSAGGAMSALVGATGNHPAYEEMLQAMGAAKEKDDVFAAVCYCPITDLEHADKGTLVLFDWSRRSVAATQDSTNSVAMLPRHAAFLVGHGLDGDCLESDVYPIVPWIVAPTSTDDSSWRNTMFASFDEDGRLARPVWNNANLDEVASPFSNAYLWDKTIEIGSDVTLNSLFMNNSGKNKWLGAGRTLTITSGGLVMHNNNTAIGQPGRTDNGSLVLGDANHPGYVFAKASNASQPNQIWADVTAPGGFVSSYSGALVLGGNQTGIGSELVVNAGVLTLGTAEYGCVLANDLPIRICAGATLGLPRTDTVNRNTMWFDGAAGQFGKIEAPEGVAAKCKKAYWRNYPETDEWQPILRGIYTGDATTAIVVGAIYDPDHFAGTGTMEVLRDDSVTPLVIRLR